MSDEDKTELGTAEATALEVGTLKVGALKVHSLRVNTLEADILEIVAPPSNTHLRPEERRLALTAHLIRETTAVHADNTYLLAVVKGTSDTLNGALPPDQGDKAAVQEFLKAKGNVDESVTERVETLTFADFMQFVNVDSQWAGVEDALWTAIRTNAGLPNLDKPASWKAGKKFLNTALYLETNA